MSNLGNMPTITDVDDLFGDSLDLQLPASLQNVPAVPNLNDQNLPNLHNLQNVQDLTVQDLNVQNLNLPDLQSIQNIPLDTLNLPTQDQQHQITQNSLCQQSALRLRLDALAHTGSANQRVAWSPSGVIASLTRDSLQVELRVLLSDPDDGEWQLSAPSLAPLPGRPSPASDTPIVHLAWSPAQVPELAVVDALGHVCILSFPTALNLPTVVYPWYQNGPVNSTANGRVGGVNGGSVNGGSVNGGSAGNDHAGDGKREYAPLVGTYWLPLKPGGSQLFSAYPGPAIRDPKTGSYRYETTRVSASGPWHITASKSMFFGVTADGLVRVYWPQPSHRFVESRLAVDAPASVQERVIHASFCSDRQKLLVALATLDGQLKLVRLTIHWDTTSHAPAPPNALPPILLSSQLVFTTSWRVDPSHPPPRPPPDHAPPSSSATPSSAAAPDIPSHLNSLSLSQLSCLQILGSYQDNYEANYAPMLLTARPSPTGQTVMDRWEIVSEVAPPPSSLLTSLFPSAAAAATTTTTTTTARSTRLRHVGSTVVGHVLLQIDTIQMGRVLRLVYADGGIEYRDRENFERIYDPDNNKTSGTPIEKPGNDNDKPVEDAQDSARLYVLSQAGFHWTHPTPCLGAAFSPSGSSMVHLTLDHRLQWSYLQIDVDAIGQSKDDPQYLTAMAGLALALGTVSTPYSNYDDVLAIVERLSQTKPTFVRDWISEIVRSQKMNIDYSDESNNESLVRNPQLHLCLSLMNRLGFRGRRQKRTANGQAAMLALFTRHIVVLVTVASQATTMREMSVNPYDEPHVVDVLTGCAHWANDLITYLTDSLFRMLEDPAFVELLQAAKFGALNEYLQRGASHDTLVTLTLLLNSSTRALLMAICRRLTYLETLSFSSIHSYQTAVVAGRGGGGGGGASRPPGQRIYAAYVRLNKVMTSALVKAQEFERMLTVLAADIRTLYQKMLPLMVSKVIKEPVPAAGQPAGKAYEAALKNTQARMELSLLLGMLPTPNFAAIIHAFLGKEVRALRAQTDPAALFFGGTRLLEVRLPPALDGMCVDSFRRTLVARLPAARGQPLDTAPTTAGRTPRSSTTTATMATAGPGVFRRCARCAAMMEDVPAQSAGFALMLSQQKRCACQGFWWLMPRGEM